MAAPDPAQRVRAACEERAARADALAPLTASAAEPLRFSAMVFRAQAGMLGSLGDFDGVARAAKPVLVVAAERGPRELAQDARELLKDPGAFAERLRGYRAGGEFDYLARAALQPFAVLQREKGAFIGRGEGPCPFCGGLPWMSSLRGGAELQGSARLLHCASCWMSWQVSRIKCPACGEEDPDKLPGFSDDKHPGARIEACESCNGYVKSIDLTLDARRVPEVDDLASIALDLWAAEEGFERLEPGLAGL